MNWGMMAAVLDHMRDRLEARARADLLEMAQVTFVKSWTARCLRENGFRYLRALAEADPKDLVPVLMMVCTCDWTFEPQGWAANLRGLSGQSAQDSEESALSY
jgi:hypothetical protein